MKTHRNSYPGLIFAAAIAIATVAPAGFAQVAPSAPPPPAATGPTPIATSSPSDISAAQADQVITLSAFEVNGQGEHGYVASESETGTRIATKISDLPFSVNVVTSTFLNDFQEYDMNSQLGSSRFTPSEVDGQFQLRGFTQTVSIVDGFRRIGLVDTVDIDRIEIIKGPAASIYGATQPGGAINFITRQPTADPERRTCRSGGADGMTYSRGLCATSGPLGNSGKLFYRVDWPISSPSTREEFASQNHDFIDGKCSTSPTTTRASR